MLSGCFYKNREKIENQYQKIHWLEDTGLSPNELYEQAKKIMPDADVSVRKAHMLAFVLDNAQLAVEPYDLFQDHIRHGNVLLRIRGEWEKAVMDKNLANERTKMDALNALGALNAQSDFGHTVPDWNDILTLGFIGLRNRLVAYPSEFSKNALIVYEAVLRYIVRLSEACKRESESADLQERERLMYCANDLIELTQHEPRTLHQALQTTYIYHIIQEEIEGERLRSLGGVDRLYERFRSDNPDEDRELWSYFFQKFHSLTGDHMFGEPMYLGGELPDGTEAVNESTYLILDAYDKLKLANPKFHIRVTKNTPSLFIKKVLDCVRRGNSSFVFISDECAIPMMMKSGATLEEAREYVPIGCYEPGIMGREVACTGNGSISFCKAVELALFGGRDPRTQELIGIPMSQPNSFPALIEMVKIQIKYLAETAMQYICACERLYLQINPSPLFSSTMIECVQRGKDAYSGGAKYNNSSLSATGCGTMTDELIAIKKLVFDSHEYTLDQLLEILKNNWNGHEGLRLRMCHDSDKWGNNHPLADNVCKELVEFFASIVNATPNARGGHFKAAIYSIDYNYFYGERLIASADGRKMGEIVSRNIGAVSTMDRNGVTAQIISVTKIDHALFQNGSVLDIMLHPSAVQGEEGLDAFYDIITTYFALGGFAIHGNVMDAAELRDAQMHPEKHANLQVRVCGWNVYFVNLSREEQDEFIRRAEAVL